MMAASEYGSTNPNLCENRHYKHGPYNVMYTALIRVVHSYPVRLTTAVGRGVVH